MTWTTASGGYRFRPRLCLLVPPLLGTSVSMRILVARLAHRYQIAEAIMATSPLRMGVVRLPVGAKLLVATARVATVLHSAFALSAGAAITGGTSFLRKSH